MKSVISMLLLVVLGAPVAVAATNEVSVRVTGIVDLPEVRLAIIESRPAYRDVPRGIFRAGERSGDFEVHAINPANGAVMGRLHGSNVVYQINPPPGPAATPPHLQLEHASLDLVLELYARLAHRSVLRSPVLPAVAVTATSGITKRSEIVTLLERQLADQGIVLVPDGEKFVAVLPKAEAARFKPAAPGPGSPAASAGNNVFPPGSINFTAAPLSACVTVYADIAGKKLDRASLTRLPDSRVVFRQQTALTRAECLYAFETLLRMQGVELQPAEDGLVKAVLISKAGR